MKTKELKTKPTPELEKLLKSTRENSRELRFKISREQFKNVRELRKVKKTVARLLTIINERKINKPQGLPVSKASKPIVVRPEAASKAGTNDKTLLKNDDKLKKK